MREFAITEAPSVHQRAEGRPCPPESGVATNLPALGCAAVAVTLVAAVVLASWTVLWVGLLASLGAVVWWAGFSPAASSGAGSGGVCRAPWVLCGTFTTPPNLQA